MREGYFLFDLDNKSFLSFIDNLTGDAIKSNSDYVIYRRGREYYDKGLVKNVSFDSSGNTVSAIVTGGEKYSVRIFSENGEIKASCSCPYEDVCKHITAVLVDKYAPSQYRMEIINRNSGKSEAKAIFRKTRNKIENLFKNEELLFSPS